MTLVVFLYVLGSKRCYHLKQIKLLEAYDFNKGLLGVQDYLSVSVHGLTIEYKVFTTVKLLNKKDEDLFQVSIFFVGDSSCCSQLGLGFLFFL